MPNVNRTAPDKQHVQSLVFSKEYNWTRDKARKWALDNKYFTDGYDETENSHRFRQYDPQAKRFTYRYKKFGEGITANIGFPKEGD